MKFLTEDDLRVKYHDFPFETFTIDTNTRLTPGARTFLLDRKIHIIDENEVIQQKRAKAARATAKETHETSHFSNQAFDDSEWLSARCELLKIAYDLTSIDTVLAEELTLLERCLGLGQSGGEIVLPQLLKTTITMDRNDLVGQLSTVGLFLKTRKGHILTRLYPLYFQLERLRTTSTSDKEHLRQVIKRLEQLIAYYLNQGEEV